MSVRGEVINLVIEQMNKARANMADGEYQQLLFDIMDEVKERRDALETCADVDDDPDFDEDADDKNLDLDDDTEVDEANDNS